MPGAFTHLTLVGLLAESNTLDGVNDFPTPAKISILDYSNFCDLGAVSPDYPYLRITDPNSCRWADLMHQQNTDAMISSGVEFIRMLDGENRQKTFAWFLGFISHIVTDTTIHPVVQLKVGPYEENKRLHRVCEMNHDAYIFPRLQVGNIGVSKYLDSGIAVCSDDNDRNTLNLSVFNAWDEMLQKSFPDQYKNALPEIHSWHASFLRNVDIAEEGPRLFAIARHIAVGLGLTYPRYDEIDMQYVANLETPEDIMHFDVIFDRAKDNVLRMWTLIANAVYNNSDEYKESLGAWNLDTGRNSNNELVYWS
jgi:hypothetical protein